MLFQTIQFPEESVQYIAPRWNELEELAFSIAQKILKDNRKIDRIITLAKGGWPQTCSLVDFLGVEYVASMGVKFYSGIGKRMDKPIIYQDVPESIRGEDVLLFDDITDTGKSFEFVKKHLSDFGVNSIITASLFHRERAVLTPDYYGTIVNCWIVFPFEARETVEQLGPKWLKDGLSRTEVMKRFKKLGFSDEVVSFYLK